MRRMLAMAVGAALSLGTVLPAAADPPRWAPAHGWKHKHHRPHPVAWGAPPVVAYVAAPVVAYVPPPVVVIRPQPVYVYPAYPRHQPGWDISIGIRFGGYL
ncbi:MAG: hypothetical protein AB1773_09600 [Pseudomonadota bacterium]